MVNAKRLLSLAVAGTIMLASCGGGAGDGDGATTGNGDVGGASSSVTMTDNAFSPADPVIAAGEVELVNEGASPHTFTIEGEDVDVQVDAGATTSATVDLPAGTYTLFCSFHRAQGMEGTLTIEE